MSLHRLRDLEKLPWLFDRFRQPPGIVFFHIIAWGLLNLAVLWLYVTKRYVLASQSRHLTVNLVTLV